jgi:hypothetical protein
MMSCREKAMSVVMMAIAGWFVVSIVTALLIGRVMGFVKRNDMAEGSFSPAIMQPPRLILANRRTSAPRPEKIRA